MAAKGSSLGVRHLTVVPTNFDPAAETDADAETGADDAAGDARA
ncbi:hypothetical protein [Candidatus Halobonum tyrrellensis]|nr:hypothetical protein [Candidatus Halobonum tyrrellensis]